MVQDLFAVESSIICVFSTVQTQTRTRITRIWRICLQKISASSVPSAKSAIKKRVQGDLYGVLFGAGHGGAEALILGLIVLVNYAAMLIMRSLDLSALVPPEQLGLAQEQIAAYWSAPWPLTLLGAVERAFALACQIFMATLVMQVFLRGNLLWLFAAIGFHALIDASAVLALQYVGPYGTEGVIAVFALISVLLTLALRRPEPQPDPSAG